MAVGILAASGDPVVPGGPLDFPNGLFHHDEPVPDAFSGDPVGPEVDAPGPEVDAPGPEADAPGPEVGPEVDAPGPEAYYIFTFKIFFTFISLCSTINKIYKFF